MTITERAIKDVRAGRRGAKVNRRRATDDGSAANGSWCFREPAAPRSASCSRGSRHVEQVIASAVRPFGPKKAIEVSQVHRFLAELGLPDDGVLLPGETPDFVYETAGRRVGIELSKLFNHRPIEDAARRERIVTEAQKLVARGKRFDGLRLWVTFGNAPLPTVRQGAQELARRAREMVATRPLAKIRQDESCLFSEISAFPNDRDARWRAVGKAESAEELTQSALQLAVDRKGQKVRQYRRSCTELWLLLMSPLFPARKPAFGQLRWPTAEERWHVRTAFDRVFVFDEDSGEPLHEVARR